MVEKARNAKIRFRPHFKTHQSAQIGEWFRTEGVSAITVSSLSMGAYFASHGWEDITVAFPFNPREIEDLWQLGKEIHLELLVESLEVVDFLGSRYPRDVDLWIKIDAGANRTGIPSGDLPASLQLAERISSSSHLHLKGILSHFGQTYHAGSAAEVETMYRDALGGMFAVKSALRKAGFRKLEISVGDTPSMSICDDLGKVEEIRPGNFIFYDAAQLRIGSCREEEIALVTACPVVAKHPERGEVILYGGAVHLSKEYLTEEGHVSYGDLAYPRMDGWSGRIKGAYIRALSQEHGIARLPSSVMEKVKVGDLLMVIPVHSCLTVAAMGEYTTLEGEKIGTMVSRSGDQAEGNRSECEDQQEDTYDPDQPASF
jgi:D-serine deaminase-like pyridoxal phosphate-dependent protein